MLAKTAAVDGETRSRTRGNSWTSRVLAELYGTQFGRFSDEIGLLEKALPVMRDKLGPGDDTTLYAGDNWL